MGSEGGEMQRIYKSHVTESNDPHSLWLAVQMHFLQGLEALFGFVTLGIYEINLGGLAAMEETIRYKYSKRIKQG